MINPTNQSLDSTTLEADTVLSSLSHAVERPHPTLPRGLYVARVSLMRTPEGLRYRVRFSPEHADRIVDLVAVKKKVGEQGLVRYVQQDAQSKRSRFSDWRAAKKREFKQNLYQYVGHFRVGAHADDHDAFMNRTSVRHDARYGLSLLAFGTGMVAGYCTTRNDGSAQIYSDLAVGAAVSARTMLEAHYGLEAGLRSTTVGNFLRTVPNNGDVSLAIKARMEGGALNGSLRALKETGLSAIVGFGIGQIVGYLSK